MGLEGFRSIIINIQQLMANGVFHNLREVELKLIYDGQVSLLQPIYLIVMLNFV